MSFPLRISSVNVTNLQFPVDLVTFTEEIVNENLHVLCSDISNMQIFLKIHEYKNNTFINF